MWGELLLESGAVLVLGFSVGPSVYVSVCSCTSVLSK